MAQPSQPEYNNRPRLLMFIITVFITSIIGALGWSIKTIRDSQESRIEEISRDVDQIQLMINQHVIGRTEYDNDLQMLMIRLNRLEDRINLLHD